MKAFTQHSRHGNWLPLLILMIAVKSLFVLSLSDVFFYGEELEKGTAAKAMLDGLPVPHHQLIYHYYEGGGFAISHLKAVAFLLVGENLLAHKLIAMLFNAAILLVGWDLTRRLFGPIAALWFGLLFVFGPESYQKLSLISLGIHFEASLFLLGTLSLGARILFARDDRRHIWFILGLVTGFGLYFSYQIALAAFWVLLTLALFRTRALFRAGWIPGLAGFLIGVIPLVVMYTLVGDLIFDIHGDPLFGSVSGRSNLELFREWLSSIYIERVLGNPINAIAWPLVVVGAAIVLAMPDKPGDEGRRARGAYVFGYLALFCLAFLNSNFVRGAVFHFSDLMRVMPLWIFGAVLIAGALAKLLGGEGRTPRTIALLTGGCLVLLGARASWSVWWTGHPESPADNWEILTHTKGYSYDQYFAKVFWHFDATDREKLELVETFDEDARGLLRADAAANVFRHSRPDLGTVFSRARKIFRLAGADRVADYELGLGPLLVIGHGWDNSRAIATISAAEPALQEIFLEALGRFGGGLYPLKDHLRSEVQRGLALDTPDPYLRGIGRFLYRRFRVDPIGAEEFIHAQPEAARDALGEGYRAARDWHTLP
jgi:hypothetical protein